MDELRHSDLQTILRVGFEAAAAPDLPAFRERVLAGAAEVVPADVVSYNEVDHTGGRPFVLSWPADWLKPEVVDAFWRLAGEHPLVAHYAATGEGRALRISDFLDRDAFHALSLYREIFAPSGLEYQIAITLPGPPERLVGLALNRRERDFDEHERLLLNLLRPYLAQAYRHVQERTALRERMGALERGLAETTEGIVVLTPAGTIDYASARACELLPEAAGARLPAPVERWFARGEAAPLMLGGLTLRLAAGGEPGVLILSESGRLPPGVELTPRELEVLASAADGRTDADIAAALHLSPRTVQRHLANVFAKLEVHTRTAAIRKVFG